MRYFRPCLVLCLIPAVFAACSYGSYDGSYTGGIDAGADGGGGTVVLTRSVDPANDAVLAAPDSVFEVTFAKGAFAAPTTVTITQLAERTTDTLIVPVYRVSAPAAPSKPFQIVFRGTNPSGGTSRALLTAQRRGDDTFAPVPITTTGLGGGNVEYWGITKELGTFSLIFETLSSSSAFFDPSSAFCFGKCCQSNGASGSNTNGFLTSSGVACQAGPNLECFLAGCSDFDAVFARAKDLSKNNSPVAVECRRYTERGAQNCPGPGCEGYQGGCDANNGPCCITANSGTCNGGLGSVCSGIAVRCDLKTTCPLGTTCCVFDTDAYCTATCPAKRKVCTVDADCDGVTCQDAPKCPFRTCGAPPPSCQ